MDNDKKILTTLALMTAVSIFCGVILLKVDVWAAKQEAELKQEAAEMEWEGYLYRQTVKEIANQK